MPRIKTAEIDAPAIRVRSRLVEALDPAGFAEQMFSRASAKTVGRELVSTFQQRELIMRHAEVEKPGLGANRAVAIEQFDWRFNLDGKANRAAMATALQLHSTVTDFARLRG